MNKKKIKENYLYKIKELQKHNRPAEIHIYADEDHEFDSQPALGRNVVDIQGIFFLKYL